VYPLENVNLIVDNSSIDDIEDAHHDENIEDIGQMSA
jgi:hypothetical protein